MPDIFGREPADYQHLRRVQDAGFQAQMYLQNRAADSASPVHDFNALGSFHGRVQDTDPNALAVGFLTNNLQAIQSMVEEILYVEFRLDKFIPFNTSVPEGAVSYAYRVVDRVGRGRFIDTGGADAPSATVNQRLVTYPLEYAGIIPEWSYEDLRRAAFGGTALDTETIKAAVEGCMDHIEDVGLNGDEERGFQGLLKHDSITVASAGSALSSMTPDEMVRFLQQRAVEVIENTNEVFGRTIKDGLCFYLPISQADRVTSTRIPQGNDLNVWNYFAVNNAWVNYTGEQIQLKWVQELKDGAANGTDDRMLVGFKNERVMEMAMPFAPRTTTTLTKAYSVCAPMEYKISGLNVKRPTAMRYYDGI